MLDASGEELERFNRGLTVLDTIITLAPLLGLLGGAELDAPQAVTGGILPKAEGSTTLGG